MLQSVNKKLESKDLLTYLKSHSKYIISRLYSYPATCLAVFRELPDLSKQFVLRLLFVDHSVSQGIVTTWIQAQHNELNIETSNILKDLHILIEFSQLGLNNCLKLDEVFKNNLKSVILTRNDAITLPIPPDKYAKDISFLDSYAQERWECILHYMVRSKDQNSTISRDVVNILNKAGLTKLNSNCGNTSEPFITPSGFQFLLLDISSQIWYFILKYLDCLELQGLDMVECLAFLFQLNFLTLGKNYSTENLTESQCKFLQNLREFGLVYQRKRTCQQYFPTRLAINLLKKSSILNLTTHSQGFIIVETNFRVYAYTASSLQLSLLAMFCKILYRFANMAVGSITRSSVREAMTIGITGDQIVNFLRSHSHEEMNKQAPVLPPTIVDQIYLWEVERDRFRFADGVLYSQFISNTEFQLLLDYARSLDVLIWHNTSRRTLIVTKEGHEDVRKFWKRHKQDSN